MKLQKKVGAVSEIWQIWIADSSSTIGAGLAGLVFNSAGLTAYYHKDLDTTATAITLATMTVGTFTSSGFKEIDATNMPGWYQFCPPNAAISTGKSCGFLLKGATNMAQLPIEVQLTATDPDSATAFMTSVASVTGAVGSVTGAVGSVTGLTASNLDATVSSRMATYTQPAGFLAATFPAGTVANTTNITAGTITTATNLTNAPTAGDLTATMKTSVTTAATAATPVATVSGDFSATMKTSLNAATPVATVSGDFSATMKTSLNASTPASISGAVGSVTGAVGSVAGAVGSVTGAVGSVGAGGITAASFGAGAIDAASLAADASVEIADTILDRNMATGTDSGSPTVRTVRQALRMLRNKASISAGTLTVTKEDDTTASWTAAVTTAAGNPIDSIDPASA